MLKYSILACALFSTLSFAQDNVNITPVSNYGQNAYVGLSGTFSATQEKNSIDDNDSLDEFGFGVQAGYFFLPYLGLEASYGLDGGLFNGENYEHTDLMLLTRYPLSDYAEIYLGGGASLMLNDDVETDNGSNVDAVGAIGVRYHVSQNWAIDLGYKFYNDPGAWESSVSTFNLGFKYYFGSVEAPKPVVEQTAFVEPEPEPVEPVVEEKVCQTKLLPSDYMVMPGDFLIKIAVNHDMSLEELIALNQSSVNQLNDINVIMPGMKLKVMEEQEVCE